MDGGPQPNAQTTIKLISGRVIRLYAITQWTTYGGLLEGIPFKKINDGIISEALAKAKKEVGIQGTPYLIDPVRRDYHDKPGDMTNIEYRLGTPEFLPSIVCIASFTSLEPKSGSHHDYSALVAVWFQNAFAFPIADSIHEHLKTMLWDKHATDADW